MLRLLDTYLRVNDRSVMLGVDTAYCFVGLVAISVIGTPFFGLIPTVILWEGSLLGLLHVAITFFHFGTYIFVVDFFFTLDPSYLIFFKNNFKICFCVKDFFFHFFVTDYLVCSGPPLLFTEGFCFWSATSFCGYTLVDNYQ